MQKWQVFTNILKRGVGRIINNCAQLVNQKTVECRDSLAFQWWGLCTSTAGGRVHLCPGTKIPAAAKKQVGHLYLRVQGPSSLSQCARHFRISLSLCHTRTSPSSLIPRPTPPPGIVWSGSSHSSLCASLVGMPFPLTNLPGKTWSISQVPGHLHLLCRTFQAEVIHSCFVLIEAHIFSSSCLSLSSLLDVSSLYC